MHSADLHQTIKSYDDNACMHRHMYEPDGHFTEHHLQDWQHSAMYLAFMLAGVIDLLAYYTQLPAGIDQVFSLTQSYVIHGSNKRPEPLCLCQFLASLAFSEWPRI